MARWKLGEAEVEALIAAGDLQKLTGEAANGERLLARVDRERPALITAAGGLIDQLGPVLTQIRHTTHRQPRSG